MIKKATRFGRLPLLGLIPILVLVALASSARGQDTTGTLEDLFTDIAMQMPEFGGMYVDEESDTLYVYWLDGGSETAVAVMEELRAILGDINLPRKVQLLPARFSFLELKQWHDSIAQHVLSLPGVTLIGIDYASNRVLIGLENSQARELVEQTLAELVDVPREAVNLIEVGPIELDTSLNDRHRPLVGGLEIQFERDTSPIRCTLGFIAIREGVLGFVTKSHCSRTRNRVDGTTYFQPTVPATADELRTNAIGRERVDPRGSRSLECFLFAIRCRDSDSNFSRLGVTITVAPPAPAPPAPPPPGQVIRITPAADLGFIARPALGSTAWDGVSTFRIVAERGLLFTGTSVTKVGAATGRTQGSVLLGVSTIREGVLLQRQFLATYDAAGGDSGAPVIRARAPDPRGNPTDTSLAGIHFGRVNFPGIGRVAMFSPIEGVQRDLGPLDTCAPPLRC